MQPASARPARLLAGGIAWALAFLAAYPASALRIASGTYVGTGIPRSFQGAAFQPALVIVKGNNNEPAVLRTASMTGTFSKYFSDSALGFDNGIVALNAGGFSLGISPAVNEPLTLYTFIAIEASPGELAIGSYTGDASPTRTINGLGFSPAWVMVFPGTGTKAIQRFVQQPPGESIAVGETVGQGSYILDMTPDGFVVSGDPVVNGAGLTHHYLALASRPSIATGSYSGDATAGRSITSGFRPEYVLLQGVSNSMQTLHRTSSNGDDIAMKFKEGLHLSGALRRFQAAGFEIGAHAYANRAGETYYWLAFSGTSIVAISDVSVEIEADRTIASFGDPVTIKVIAQNHEGNPVTGLSVNSRLPAGFNYTGHAVTRGVYNPGSGDWLVGALNGGESAALTLNATVAAPGPAKLLHTATVTGMDQSDKDLSNNADTLTVEVINREFRMTTGTYTGNAAAARAITGLGFTPDVVLITGENAAGSVMRTSTMPAGFVKELGRNNVLLVGAVNSLDADGFTVGNHATTNASGITYHWTAFQSAAGSMKVGSYTGNGTDDRSITGVGFRPGYLIVMASRADDPMQRFAAMGGDASATFVPGDLKTDRIQALEADGFQVGKHNTVNENTFTFHYVAWKDGATQARTGMYIGNGAANHPRTDVGFRPLQAIICRQTNGAPAAHRSASVTGDKTLPFTANAPLAGGITAFTAGGFDLGPNVAANQAGVLYFWAAFRDNRETDVSVKLAQSSTVPNVGDTLTLDVVVSNLGPADATGLEIAAPVPAGMALVSVTPGSGSYSAGTGKWTVGSLANGVTLTLSMRARIQTGTGGSRLVQSASVSALTELDPNSTNDTASAGIVVQAAELSIAVYGDTAFASVGDTLRFTAGIANNGPNAASGVRAALALPAFLSHVSHAGDGTYDPGTGVWTVGPVPALGASTITFVTTVDPGADGRRLTLAAAITAANQEDPAPGNNSGQAAVQVITPIALLDAAASLYPASAAAGQPALALRIDVDNSAGVGVTLATTSTISFTDGTSTYAATLKNPTFVPANASDFTLSFAAAAVPATVPPGASYDLRLALQGTTAESWAYADTFSTAGRNAILITDTEMVLSATIVGDALVNPGDTGVELLRLEFQSSYPTPRTLDSLTVTNTSTGAGTPAQLDGLVRAVHLYGDMDGNGALGAPDALLGSTVFTGGRAVFPVGGAWTIPASSVSRLILTVDVDSTRARDGDRLNAAIAFEEDIVFAEPTSIAGTISPLTPLDSYGRATIDGMVAMQVAFTDTGVDTLVSGSTDVWIATIVLPTNGYADDVLHRIEIADFSGGFDRTDLSALDLVRDDGDGVYTSGVDLPLGRLAFSGDRYQLSGLSAPVTAATRFFLVATAAPAPADGDLFRPGIPVGGAQMASGNDGPIDAAVVSARTLVFRRVEEITVTGRALSPLTVTPGRAAVSVLRFDVRNNTPADAALDSLVLTNASTGVGGTAELDGNFRAVSLYTDNGDGVVGPADAMVASGLRFASGVLPVGSLGIALPSGATVSLLVACDVDSSCAADGDLLALSIASASRVVTTSAAPVQGAFPMTTNPARPVNGMVAHQIRMAAAPDTVLAAGSTNNRVFDVRLHGNGYAADVLQSFTIENLGTATDAHFSRLAFFADGGNGVFDAGAGDDVHLGDLSAIGANRFRITGLSSPLPGPCGQYARFYVSADVAVSPPSGASLQFSIPVSGIAVASGNDGPIDSPVACPSVHLIPRPDELSVFPYSVGDKRVRPATGNVLNSGIGLYNGFNSPLVLNGLNLFQKGSASSSEIVRVRAWTDQDNNGLFNPILDVPLATTTSTGVFYPLSGFNLTLPPKKISYVFVTYDLALSVRDSVSVNLQINSESDISLSNPSVLRGEFPVDSPGQDVTDGMVTAQMTIVNAPGQTVPPGEPDVFVLGFTVPRNGQLPDVFERVTISNAGSAMAGQDVLFLNLWAEGSGNSTFDPAADRLLASLTWNGSGWRNASPLAESIPSKGLRCYVSASFAGTAVDGRTFRALLPLNGVRVASGNDGPIDASVLNPGTQVVSTDPLIASVSTDRSSYSAGQPIIVSMNVRNAGTVALAGVFPDTLWTSGAGIATPNTGPVPVAANLTPGESRTFTWTFTAVSPGPVTFCGSASDSSTVSLAACADPVFVQSRPSAIAAAFHDRAPSGVNRGQRSVPALTFEIDHNDPAALAAGVRIRALTLGVADNGGAPAAPSSFLSGVTLVNSSGTNTFFSLADSVSTPVRLTLPQSIVIERGQGVDVDILVDVAPSAVLAPFRIVINAAGDLGVSDANDGAVVGLSSGTPFPWMTSAIDVDEPATLVRVSDDVVTAAAANVGQRRVVIWDGTMENGSPAGAATAAVTSVTIDFHDGSGGAITPVTEISRLVIFGGGTRLFETLSPPAASTARFDFPSAMLLPPQQPRSFVIEADIQNAPASARFGITLRTPTAVAVRDNNSGAVLTVAPAGGASFPLVSRTITFEQPATGLAAALTNLAPGTILPATAGVGIARVRLAHADAVSSSIEVDSLALVFRTPDGAAFYPGNYFNRIVVLGSADTLASLTTLSSVSSLVPCRFASPLVLAPTDADSLSIVVDVKNSYVPASFVVRIDRESIHAVDANDPGRAVGISGAFPMQSSPASLSLPGDDVRVSAASTLPPNVVGNERSLRVMDMRFQNRSAPGYTASRLESLTVVVQGRGRAALATGTIVAGARLALADSVVCAGSVTPAGIVFSLPAGWTLAPGTARDVSLEVDLAGNIATSVFRFAVPDATAVVLSDATTTAPVAPAAEGGFPLATQYTTVLSADAAAAFTNYPNPFPAGRGSTRVTFFLEHPSKVTLRVFTLWGDPVVTLLGGVRRAAGLHQDISWDGRNGDGNTVNNGVYYMVLDIAPDAGAPKTLRRKVAVLR